MQHWYRAIGSISVFSLILGFANQVPAQPADVFTPHLERIQQTLPPNFKMRLPDAILLNEPADEELIETLRVRVFASAAAPGVVVGLYTCDDPTQFCLVGTFAVTAVQSRVGQQQFAEHRAAATPITLSPTVRGYLLEGFQRSPRSGFSSVMWQQDGMLYSIRFAYPERQNILYMAKSMVIGVPVVSVNPQLLEPPKEGSR